MTTAKQLEATEAGDAAVVPDQPDLNVQRIVKDTDGDGKADKAGPKQAVSVYDVQIERSNNEKIAAEVFGFEIPILNALHGEQAVTLGGDPGATIDDVEASYEATIDGDANSVLRMLQNKYNNANTGDVVSRVYPDAATLAEKAGFQKPRGKLKGPVVSENTDNRKKK